MRRPLRWFAAMAVILFALTLGSCWWWYTDPVEALVGTWQITEKPAAAKYDPHLYFVFTANAAGYEIQETGSVVFESGPIANLTYHDFDYTIQVQTKDALLVGEENYASYTLAGTTLRITFYDDATRTTTFGTIVAEMMP